MSSPDPGDTYLVGGAGLPQRDAPPGFRFKTARGFQAEAIEWIQEKQAPVGLLAAPTGAGKTLVIASLAEASQRILCLYPTNALTEAQANTLKEEYGLSVEVLNGRTLEQRGADRSAEVMGYADDPGREDVVITNPDVLQAIIGDQYISPGSELLRFFAYFDAAVYDEFHYYDPLAASGMLLQIKVLSERGKYRGSEGELHFPRVLLSSATPAQSFVDHVAEDIELSVRRLRSELAALDIADPGPNPKSAIAYDTSNVSEAFLNSDEELRGPEGPDDFRAAEEARLDGPAEVDRFRYPMVVNRWDDDVDDAFDTIARALRTGIGLDNTGEPTGRAAVIFNSAARSNLFHQYLLRKTDLGEFAVKDNGYDTRSERSQADDFAILNTTSKGEVGLDFNLNRLVMVKPFTASAFVQRIGRAARHSPAIVDVFGLKNPTWPPVQSYPAFLARVVDSISDSTMRRDRLRDLVGLRAARALSSRTLSDHYHAADIFDDFADVTAQGRWSRFLAASAAAEELHDPGDDPFAKRLDGPTAKLHNAVKDALAGLDSLRGRSVSQRIQYPFGDGKDETEYDLVTALRHYRIRSGSDDLVVLENGTLGGRRGHYPGKPAEGRGIDLAHSNWRIDNDLRTGLEAYLDSASLSDTDLREQDLRRFLKVVDLSSAMLPDEIHAEELVFHCSDRGEVDRIEEEEDSA